MLFYLERTGRTVTDGRRPRAASAPSDEAAAFEIAHPVRVLGITTVGEWQATTKVTLALDPTLSAAQVAAMWQKVRSGVLRQGARGRTVSRKSLALALFVAHHPGRTWADLRRMWNQLYAHWAFKSPDLRVFRNAAVRARRYLLEPPELDDMGAGTWQWVPAAPRAWPRAPTTTDRGRGRSRPVAMVFPWTSGYEPSRRPRSTPGRVAWGSGSSSPSPRDTASTSSAMSTCAGHGAPSTASGWWGRFVPSPRPSRCRARPRSRWPRSPTSRCRPPTAAGAC